MGCIACSLVTTMIRPDPPGGAAFDAFPADDQRQQSGVAEDLGHSPAFPVFAEEVSFELVGIDDARRSDVGHGPQAAQVRGSSGVNSLLIAVPFRMRRHIRQRPHPMAVSMGCRPLGRTSLEGEGPKGRGIRQTVQAMVLALRDLTPTVTPAPIRRAATTVNSTVPAPPVSGSWVMLFTFSTTTSAVLPSETSPQRSLLTPSASIV